MLRKILSLLSKHRPSSGNNAPPEYTETSSGFRYRLLSVRPQDGCTAATAALLPGELLYRMMDGEHRVGGNLFPVLMNDATSFAESVSYMSTRGWSFQLAAGIPVVHTQPVP